jgi:hypothetical protein
LCRAENVRSRTQLRDINSSKPAQASVFAAHSPNSSKSSQKSSSSLWRCIARAARWVTRSISCNSNGMGLRETQQYISSDHRTSSFRKRNTGRPKNMQAELQSATGNRMKIVFLVIGWQNDRDNVAYLKIDRRTQLVQNSGERCTHRNQFENAVFSTQKGSLFAGVLPMVSVRRTQITVRRFLRSSCCWQVPGDIVTRHGVLHGLSQDLGRAVRGHPHDS